MATFDEQFSRMAALCSVSEHCESEVRERLQADYENMRSSFIYGEAPDFDKLMSRLEELQERFRAVGEKI